MNEYRYQDITVGQKESFTAALTEEHLSMFQAITGDNNPLHVDAQYAKEKGFPERVLYGMLTASFLSTLAGVYLPGVRSLIHEVEVKFLKPLLLSDASSLLITGEVIEKADMFQRMTVKVSIENAKNEKVLRAKMKIGVVD